MSSPVAVPLHSVLPSGGLLGALLLLSACGLGIDPLVPWHESGDDTSQPDSSDSDADADNDADSDADADTDADTDLEPLDVTSVTPNYGSTAGNDPVTIAGGPFDMSAVVTFGSATATVDSVSGTEILVHTPAYAYDGYVPVNVTTSSHTGRLPSAFRFFEDGTGKAGSIGEIALNHTAGSYWDTPDGTVPDTATAWTAFIEPVDTHVWDWYSDSTDHCVSLNDYVPATAITVLDIGARDITLLPMPKGTSFDLIFSTKTGIFEGPMDTSQYAPSLNLDTISATDWPAISIADFVATPPAFAVTSPALDSSTVGYIGVGGLHFTWDGTPADKVIIRLYLFNADGTGDQEEIGCVVNDDGDFTVPPSVWTTSWPTNRQLTMTVIRVALPTGTLPTDRSESRVQGEYAVTGAFFTR